MISWSKPGRFSFNSGFSQQDLKEFLEQIGSSKYHRLLEEQDIDLRIFLTLTENDLKEVGIT